ncbi:hypothetical protein F8388_017120 [Cannabis sativa]|uniref:Phosphoglycerate mutase-like protein 4 n=1 Tax=Cannabis sativa TaxID=3483 RepID=A0A7J6GCT6_CANSA|nr:hypothetical protein F8388_017120 [Cannabis sativa]
MRAVPTCLPVTANWLLSSSSSSSSKSQSSPNLFFHNSFRFRALHQLLRRNVSSTLTLTRCSTHLLRKVEFSMAESDSSCDNIPAYAEIVVVRHGETEWNHDGRIQGHLDIDLNDAGRQQAVAVAERLSKEPKISVVYSSDLKRALVTAETIAAKCGGLEVIKDTDLRERHLGDLQGKVYSDAVKACPEAYKAFTSPSKDQEIPSIEVFLSDKGQYWRTLGDNRKISSRQGVSILSNKHATWTYVQLVRVLPQACLRMNSSACSVYRTIVKVSVTSSEGGGESRDQLFVRCTSALQRIGNKHKGERVVVVTHGGVIRSLYKRACPNEKTGLKVLNTSVNVFHLSDGDKWTLQVRGDVSHLDQTGFLESGFGGDKNSG